MSIFNFFKKSKPSIFVTPEAFKENISKQKTLSPQTLQQLRDLGISKEKELILDVFFYTNTIEKAKALGKELQELNYNIQIRKSAENKNEFVVMGQSPKIKMDETIIVEWTEEMTKVGYKHDCDFDGWGTDPTQK